MDEESVSHCSGAEGPADCSSDESVCGPDAECLREVIVEGDSSEDEELILLPRNDYVGFYFRD